jgi:hypothetical protein
MKINKPSKPSTSTAKSTARSSNTPGGGIGSKAVVRGGVRNGQMPFGVNPGAVAQLGASQGNHVTEGPSRLSYRGERWPDKTPIGVRLGNEVAAATKCGPGGSREVFKSGSQKGMPVTPQPPSGGRGILSDFGPDSAQVRNRK